VLVLLFYDWLLSYTHAQRFLNRINKMQVTVDDDTQRSTECQHQLGARSTRFHLVSSRQLSGRVMSSTVQLCIAIGNFRSPLAAWNRVKMAMAIVWLRNRKCNGNSYTRMRETRNYKSISADLYRAARRNGTDLTHESALTLIFYDWSHVWSSTVMRSPSSFYSLCLRVATAAVIFSRRRPGA